MGCYMKILSFFFEVYYIPFYFIYNPEILLIGSWQEILVAGLILALAGVLLARALTFFGSEAEKSNFYGIIDLMACLAVGTSTLWLEKGSVYLYAMIVFGVVAIYIGNRNLKFEQKN